ncbi:hypothetical protein [Deinococcus frigens]|uniref:hypothetical protein n=1 Tax=Deinococcus frigens TaxID=249403 RepID=UPI000495907B|nr:hypothetical protein [Deinococcus frigens]
MTRRSRLARLEGQRPAVPEETPENFAMRLRGMNNLMGKYGVPPMTPEEFRLWGSEVRRCGGVQAWVDLHGHGGAA